MAADNTLARLVRQANNDSERYFGNNYGKAPRALVHHSLSLAGESGEFANIVKKIDRGSLDIHEASVHHKLAMELVDCFIYILNLAAVLNIDLEKAHEYKRIENNRRFGNGTGTANLPSQR